MDEADKEKVAEAWRTASKNIEEATQKYAGIQKDFSYLQDAKAEVDAQATFYQNLTGTGFHGFPSGMKEAAYKFRDLAIDVNRSLSGYPSYAGSTGTGIVTSASTGLINHFGQKQLGSPADKSTLSKFVEVYKEKEDIKAKIGEIMRILGVLLQPENNKFEEIVRERNLLATGTHTVDALAFKMRTLLEKVKGEIKDKLPNKQNVGKHDILPAYAEQVLEPTKATSVYYGYLKNAETYKQMEIGLGDVGKLRKAATENKFYLIFDEFVSVLFSILVPLKI
jgi:hypothetical protein